jgi:hypothetical protein
MARRRFTVRDIAEILEHWQAGRSISAISRSLGVCRGTVRKYVYAVEARGYRQGDPTPPQGWKTFLREVIPKPPNPSTRSEVFAKPLPYQNGIREALATTTAATIWQRLRDDEGVKVSKPSFYRYMQRTMLLISSRQALWKDYSRISRYSPIYSCTMWYRVKSWRLTS